MTPTDRPSEFDRFKELTRRILTTPKAQLVNKDEKAKARKPQRKKRK